MSVAMDTMVPTKTTSSRRYQDEIFEQARKGNVIAVLRPGSGKTYISVMLIRHMAFIENGSRKNVIFIVPLAVQQAAYIAQHTGTSLKVIGLHASNAPPLSDKGGWNTVYASHQVLVMTGQYVDPLLLRTRQVNLGHSATFFGHYHALFLRVARRKCF